MNQTLLFLHLLGLVMGLGAGMANAVIMGQAGKSDAATAKTLRTLPPIFARLSAIGLALLLVTGPILIFTKYSGHAPDPASFGIKMGLVLAVVAAFGWMQVMMAQLRRTGDPAIAGRMALVGPVLSLLTLATMLVAVFAFE